MPAKRHLFSELSALTRLALPLAAATAAQPLMGVVDTAVTGRAGAVILAGTGLGNALFFAFAVFGIGLMAGLEPLIAQSVGAGDRSGARRWLWQGAWLSLAVAAVLAIPIALLPLTLSRAGVPPAVVREATRYMWCRIPGLPAFLFYFAARAYLQGLGRTRPALVAAVVANVVNFGTAMLLVFGGGALPAWAGPLRAIPPLGAAGAALGTSFVTWLQAGVLALAAQGLAEKRVPRRPVARDLAAALRVGLPVGLQMGAEVGVFALVGLLAGRLGPLQMAAHQVALNLASLTFCVALGIGNAGSVRVGWAVGARDRVGARRAGIVAFGAAAGFMAAAGLLFALCARPLARLLTDDPGVLAIAVPLLAVAAVFQISDGVQAVGSGVLRGVGDTRFTFVANVLGHWGLGLPLALVLGVLAGRGVVGLWWGLCAGLTAVALALLARFLQISRREIRPLAPAMGMIKG